MTVKGLKMLLRDLPDESPILFQDQFSEYSYEIIGADRCRTTVDYKTDDGNNVYLSNTLDYVYQMFEDEDMTNEERIEYMQTHTPALLLYID